MSLMCKFMNENMNNTNCSKEYSDFWEVAVGALVDLIQYFLYKKPL